MTHRMGRQAPRSSPSFTGSRTFGKKRNGGLRRQAAVYGARNIVRAAVAVNGPPQEHKFFDLDIDDAVVSAGAVIVQDSCNTIAQGLTDKTRIGRKVTVKSIGWRFDLTLPESDAGPTPVAPDVLRVILYLDKQANKLTAANTDILSSADYQSFNNLSNKGRFRTLMDRTYALNYNNLASDNADVVSSSKFVLSDSFFKDVVIPIEFSAGTGALTEITSNNIGVLVCSKNGTGGFESKMRLRFTDS